jgi:hypothetical protein
VDARKSETLYLAAVVATRYNNSVIKTVDQPLCGVGKAKKAARIPCIRKLLTTRVPPAPEFDHAFAIGQVCHGIRRISSVFPMTDALR